MEHPVPDELIIGKFQYAA